MSAGGWLLYLWKYSDGTGWQARIAGFSVKTRTVKTTTATTITTEGLAALFVFARVDFL